MTHQFSVTRSSKVFCIIYFLFSSIAALAECNNKYSYDVNAKPIIDARCVECHQPAEDIVAPYYPAGSYFRTYAEVSEHLDDYVYYLTINQNTGNAKMPPGNITALTSSERQLLIDWVNEGGKEKPCVVENSTLTVAKSPSGAGSIKSTDATPAIDCGSNCSQSYSLNTKVTLKASAVAGYQFVNFTGCDAPSGDTCVQTLNNTSEAVTANFQAVSQNSTLTVAKSPSGGGSIKSTDANPAIDCGSNCSQTYAQNTKVTLKAAAVAGYQFVNFTGCDAPSGDSCVQTLNNTSESVTANFQAVSQNYMLNIVKSPTSGGTVTSTSPASPVINCGSNCSQSYPPNTKVTLKAAPAAGYKFVSFSGCDAPSGDQCIQTMDKSSETVTVNFASTTPMVLLMVNAYPKAAAGTISSTAPATPVINCGSTCSQSYPVKTKVTLKAVPAPGYKFVNFTGCDSASGDQCVQTLDKTSELVTANFSYVGIYTLSVNLAPGANAGILYSSSPATPEIKCGTDGGKSYASCSQTYAKGTVVKLSARPASGYYFTGWTGCDSYSLMECTQTIDQNSEKITANYVTALPRIDHIVALPPETVVPDERGDYMFNATQGLGLKAGKTYYIGGSQIVAKDPNGKIYPGLHHLLVNKLPKNGGSGSRWQSANANSGIMSSLYKTMNLLGGYVPGNGLFVYPQGAGGAIQGDDTLMFSIHINVANVPKDTPNVVYIQWNVMLVESPDLLIHNTLVVNPMWEVKPDTMKIPANTVPVTHSYIIDPFQWTDTTSQNLTLVSTLYHMHQWGIGGEIDKISKSGSSTLLHATTDYSFAYQKNYFLTTPVEVTPGIKINFMCKWDNSQANQPYVNGVQLQSADLYWGESSYDEMCMNVLTFTEKVSKFPKK